MCATLGWSWASPVCAAPKEAVAKTIPLAKYLQVAGKKLDCHFTIEYAEKGAGGSPIWQASVAPEVPASAAKLVEKLKQSVPQARFVQGIGNGQIIHIIDARLMDKSGYVLGNLGTVTYSGAVGGLPDAIRQQCGNNIYTQTVFPTGWASTVDTSTPAVVPAVSRPIRDILSDAVPDKDYSRVIWSSEIQGVRPDGTYQVWVSYLGKQPSMD
jgi:hypothetical protein